MSTVFVYSEFPWIEISGAVYSIAPQDVRSAVLSFCTRFETPKSPILTTRGESDATNTFYIGVGDTSVRTTGE